MSSVETFKKILNIKMIEKDQAQKDYQNAMDQFEASATELYYLLKEKEDFEAHMKEQIQSRIRAYEIRNYHQYIQSLNQKINELQQHVQRTRANMENKQQSLTESYIEVKKYEKIVFDRKLKFKQMVEKQENEVIDEASVQQYIRHREKVKP
ncbi:hypothetical protein GCM10008986_22960 [Salinibacillus aidingensis]|uniref:Flagellar FliJ protein n=1 Tax=Salinibacillus aidingensis TaxID=237684 RepID=A0ABP3LAJ8_9BACI